MITEEGERWITRTTQGKTWVDKKGEMVERFGVQMQGGDVRRMELVGEAKSHDGQSP